MNEPKHRITRVATGAPALDEAREQMTRSEDAVARAVQAIAAHTPTEGEVSVNLPDGRFVTLEPPRRSTAALVTIIAAGLTGDMDGSTKAQLLALASVQPLVEALLHVRAVDGQRIEPITSAARYVALADRIGDPGIRVIQVAIAQHWPQPSSENLEQIKKN